MIFLLERARFFLQHAGSCTPPGRVACALILARAEARAEALGLRVVWEEEQEAWDGDCPPPNVHACAYVEDASGRALASLGSIGLDSWRDPYTRVIEAELFDESLALLDLERDAIAASLASELAQRPTYAGPA